MHRILVTTLALIATLVVPFLTANAASPESPARACAASYVVQPGDNLFRIGLKYGLAWPAIAAANGLGTSTTIHSGQVLCIPASGSVVTVTPTKTPTAGTPTPTKTPSPIVIVTPAPNVPTFFITGVTVGKSVSISATNFPPNTGFVVLMGPYGSLGVNGTQAGTQNSGTGAFTATYNIPASLANSAMIAIRLQSTNGFFSYNWFYN